MELAAVAEGIRVTGRELPPQPWDERTTRRIAAQIKSLRLARGMRALDLSDTCSRLGVPIPRGVIAKLETGSRRHISVPELLVLSLALEVSPVELLLGNQPTAEIAPHLSMGSDAALEWLCGEGDRQSLTLRHLRRHRALVRGLLAAVNADHDEGSTSTRIIHDGRVYDSLKDMIRVAGDDLADLRGVMARLHHPVPPLPRELAFIDMLPVVAHWEDLQQGGSADA